MKNIYVTNPHLPELERFTEHLKEIWESGRITNGGGKHTLLERKLEEFLGVEHISLFNNGTIALLTAIKALNIKGSVITTPYSFVATSHSLLWNELTPIFVDIDPISYNIDPSKIEEAITQDTSAIMPVHCYGNPCEHDKIQKIADKHGLKVIYDAAHAFGVEEDNGSILNYGDLSILSFHATKVFNTFEGGAIVSKTKEDKLFIDQLKNFGFVDEVTVVETGINGKLSEINAAIGLLQLEDYSKVIEKRKIVSDYYREGLKGIRGIEVNPRKQKIDNYSYFPINVTSDYPLTRDELYTKLKENNIYARRYFYPLITDFPMYKSFKSAKIENLPIANKVKKEILCLPIYPSLELSDLDRIVTIIKNP